MTSVEYLASPFKDAVKGWLSDLRASNVNYLVTSTKRTREEQAKLYASRQGCTGCLPAAPPGHSKHELGLAIDIVFDETRGGDLTAQDIIGMADDYGLYMPLPSADPVHWESRTTQVALAARAEKITSWATTFADYWGLPVPERFAKLSRYAAAHPNLSFPQQLRIAYAILVEGKEF